MLRAASIAAIVFVSHLRFISRHPPGGLKARLAELLRNVPDGIAFNQHFTGDGAAIFKHACELGCEGIVSKRLGSHYRSRDVSITGSRSRTRRRRP